MAKTWFYRSLLSYIPMFFLATSILIGITFFVINDLSRKEMETSNRLYLENIMQTIDNQLRSIDQAVMKEIETNELLRTYFLAQEEDRFWNNYRISLLLKDFHNSFPLVDSVYLVRHSDGMVMSRNTMLKTEQFGDGEFISQFQNRGSTAAGWIGPRAFQEFASQRYTKPVVTIVRHVPLLSGSYGFVVVNVDVRAIRQMVQQLSHSRVNSVFLYNADGRPLFQPEERPDGEWPAEGAVSVTSDYTGWALYSEMAWEGMFANLLPVFSYAWICTAVFTLLLGTMWIIYVSRKQYEPIQSMVDIVQNYVRHRSRELMQQGGGDEFAFMEASINQLLEEHHHFQKKNEENLIYKRRYFFYEVMEGERLIGRQEWNEKMGEFGLAYAFQRLLAAVVEIDHAAEFAGRYDAKDQHLIKYVLMNVLQEVAAQRNLRIWAEWTRATQLGILCLLDEADDLPQVKTVFDEAKGWVEKHLHITVSAGIGTPVHTVQAAAQSFQDANTALSFNLAFGGNCVLDYAEVVKQPKNEIGKILPLIHMMAQCVRRGEEGWKETLAQCFARLKRQTYTNREINHLLHYMVYTLHQQIHELSADYQEVWETEGLAEDGSMIDAYENLDELHQLFQRSIEAYLEKVCALKAQKSNSHLIQEIRTYVESNYQNPDLSLIHLSERFSITPNYLSRLFKEEFGEKFVDYLMNVRMSRAKALLLETDDPVQVIAAKVGYIHANSFIRTFKKAAGVTPGDFRKTEG